MWMTIALTFLAGVLGANATPHLVKGITKEHFPTPFGSGPLINVLAGWLGYVITALLLFGAHVTRHPTAAFIAGSLGALVMCVFHARVGAFGKKPPATT